MSQTLIMVILDESASMYKNIDTVLNGFNTFIEEQKKVECDNARLFMIKFNTRVTEMFDGMKLNAIPKFTIDDYYPNGMTALYDAIAKGVSIAEMKQNPGERVICVIMTDGAENSSVEVTNYKDVVNLINNHELMDDWSFIYIGDHPDW